MEKRKGVGGEKKRKEILCMTDLIFLHIGASMIASD